MLLSHTVLTHILLTQNSHVHTTQGYTTHPLLKDAHYSPTIEKHTLLRDMHYSDHTLYSDTHTTHITLIEIILTHYSDTHTTGKLFRYTYY